MFRRELSSICWIDGCWLAIKSDLSSQIYPRRFPTPSLGSGAHPKEEEAGVEPPVHMLASLYLHK